MSELQTLAPAVPATPWPAAQLAAPVSLDEASAGAPDWSGAGGGSPAELTACFTHYAPDQPADLSRIEPAAFVERVSANDPSEMLSQIATQRAQVTSAAQSESDSTVQRGAEQHELVAHQAETRSQIHGQPGGASTSGTAEACVPYPSQTQTESRPPAEAHGTNTAELTAEIDAALATEIAELGQAHQAAVCDLEGRFLVQLSALDGTASSTLGGFDSTATDRLTNLQGFADTQITQLGNAAQRHTMAEEATRGSRDGEVLHQAETETNRVRAEASQQIAANDRIVAAQVAQLRSAKTHDAAAARDTGTTEAAAARSAANARAGESGRPAAEATAIRAQGEARATQALATANARAADIEHRADAEIAAADLRRTQQDQVITARMNTQLGPLEARATATQGSLRTAANTASSNIESTASNGALQVQGERTGVTGATTTQRGQLAADAANRRTALLRDKETALARLQAEHDRRVAAATQRATQTRARLARGGGDIAAQRRMVTGSLRAIDEQSVQSEASERAAVDSVARTISQRVARDQAAIQARARQANAALDALERQARARMTAERTRGEARMTQQAAAGERNLGSIAADAIRANHREADRDIGQLRADGAHTQATLTAAQAQVNTSLAGLERTAADTEQVVRAEMAASARQEADRALAAGSVNPANAIAAMNTLSSLPDNVRGPAIDAVQRTAVDAMLTNVPAERREEFGSLFTASQDPDRKLALWREFHVAHTDREMNASITATRADSTLSAADRAQREQQTRNIMASTHTEVRDTEAFLRNAWSAHPTDAAHQLDQINRLARWKEDEHLVERDFNVNMTNTFRNNAPVGPATAASPTAATQGNMPTGFRVWDSQALAEVRSGLSRLPAEHILGNRMFTPGGPTGLEIRRSDIRRDFVDTNHDGTADTWRPTSNVGGDHGNGVITMYDTGLTDDYRHTRELSVLANHNAGQSTPTGPVTPLEETIVHEVGHDVEDHFAAQAGDNASVRFRRDGGGWGAQMTEAQLRAQLATQVPPLTRAQIDAEVVRANANSGTRTGGDTVYERDGNFVSNNQYHGRDRNAIPEAPRDPNERDHWWYARTAPEEHWAESYANATHNPEQYYQDMVANPGTALEHANDDVTAANRAHDHARNPEELRRADERLARAQAAQAEAAETNRQRNTQHTIMRNQVFGTDGAQVRAATDLAGVPTTTGNNAARQARIDQFNAAATRAMTPEQVERLRVQAASDIRAL